MKMQSIIPGKYLSFLRRHLLFEALKKKKQLFAGLFIMSP